ncbi:aminotransferase class III-fold pyridoxal phosphate-dependent enzyme [Rhizobium leguminosarum]|uniref:aminotransferase family protein n=1 Tax=Rhizobium leguminosarum TaxID=384 RepID=UPI0024A91140|nr:aminotransferase class III-fold pyridoxal phosphate-dependent enzyme [Rhizobium leguminosarum]MDI5930007.1 aminotransferase class III-fold pyridoxal phosphate-dependent enzyme [Rhizobium leguminosarum]
MAQLASSLVSVDPSTGLIHRPSHGGPQDLFYRRRYSTWFPTIVRGEGIYLWDDRGNRYLDAIAGAAVSSLGQGNRRVADAMSKQAQELTYTYVRYARHFPNLKLSERISSLAGPGYERCLFISGGSEANDMAVKLLRQRAVARGEMARTRMISLNPSFHGNTLGTIALTGDDDQTALYSDMVQFSSKIPAPMTYRLPEGKTVEQHTLDCVRALEACIDQLGAETVLGFIIEPIGGNATGATVPTLDYLRGIREVCTRKGIALIYDEVMTGIRGGAFLQAQQDVLIKPDLVVLAKGLGAGFTPIGCVLAPAAMVDDIADLTGFNPSHTYNANPISCATALAVVNETIEQDLIGNSARTGAYFKERLGELAERCPIIGEVRGKGLMVAIELVADKPTKSQFPSDLHIADQLRLAGLANGIILYARRQSGGAYGEWSMFTPPLIITPEQVDELVERLERSLNDLMDKIRSAGVKIG